MIRDMQQSLTELASTCGLPIGHLQRESLLSRTVYKLVSSLVYTPEGALVPGSAVHETGGAPMGDDPESSVLNRFNQCWDAPNLYITDSASFTTAPFQNPGLTIMALSARAGNHIADAHARGTL
jgi:choline dehydrogenase-like flavoprotein